MSAEQVNERVVVDPGQIVMPFYLLCDASYSMSRDMDALNDGVRRLWGAILAEPVVYDVAQVCIMSFATTARVHTPMGQVTRENIPELCVHAGENGTDYSAAFAALAQAIRQDVAALHGAGYRVFRPCAFFLTDGAPGDREWARTFTEQLTYDPATRQGMRQHPIFVPFGFRDAPENVLRQLAYPRNRGKWYHARTDDVTHALKGILDIIMNTVVNSAQSTGSSDPNILQEPPAQGSAISQGDSAYDPNFVDPDSAWE